MICSKQNAPNHTDSPRRIKHKYYEPTRRRVLKRRKARKLRNQRLSYSSGRRRVPGSDERISLQDQRIPLVPVARHLTNSYQVYSGGNKSLYWITSSTNNTITSRKRMLRVSESDLEYKCYSSTITRLYEKKSETKLTKRFYTNITR